MKKWKLSKILSLALSFALTSGLLSASAWAAEVTYPTDAYTTGDTLTASGLNEKFNEIKAGVNDNNSKADTNATNIGANSSDISELYIRTTSATPDVGDMQYWDGTNWVLVPAPSTDANTLSFCGGVPTWTSGGCYRIGNRGPAGGIVFYVTDGGAHGLEAAPVDQSAGAAWGCGFSSIGTNTAIGTGAQNTADIIAASCVAGAPAAEVADAYTLNGYDDWFLPSKDELNQLYVQKDVVGGFADVNYWSSSEYDSTYAWIQNFNDGGQGYYDKVDLRRVRAVRAF